MDKYYDDSMRMDDVETELEYREIKEYVNQKIEEATSNSLCLESEASVIPEFTITKTENNDLLEIDMMLDSKYPENDPVNHPSHYTQGKIECIDYILDKKFNYCLGNAIKYITRCNYKGKKIEDLEKAIFYLKKEIEETKQNS